MIEGLIVGVIALIIGVVLVIANKFLHVEESVDLKEVVEMLPGFNCGACGYPGCEGMGKALLKKEVDVTACKPGKEDMRVEIGKYLEKLNNN